MKSKEDLETLFDLLCGREHTNSEHNFWLKLYHKVREDLEILEMLKPKLIVEKGSTWEYLEVKHPFFDTQDEIDKVKEWLKDETH